MTSPINTGQIPPALQNHHGTFPQSQTFDVIENRIDSEFGARRWKLNRKAIHASLQNWDHRNPYHEYVHQLVAAGWENLQGLEDYLSHAVPTQDGLVVSVLDITHDFKRKLWSTINNERELKKFMGEPNREDSKVRLYMVEYADTPATCIIEAFGSALKLDPRFFNWSIKSKGHVLTASQRHRAPYINLGFAVLNGSNLRNTGSENFKVLIYIKPDDEGDGWTGIIFFSSHTKIDLSPRIVTEPPPFSSQIPPPKHLEPQTFRELFIESFESVSLEHAASSPFYAMSTLLRLNCFCWNQIITNIREEDHRINGISDTSVGHAEEIKKSLDTVKRGGSLGWRGREDEKSKEVQEALEEDFKHLVDQTDLLWKTREKMATIRQKSSETRWNTLTNAFTYIFAPVTIISGVYGMNVSQISGSSSNPNIWQFFVAVAVFNIIVLLALAVSNWIQIQIKHGRAAGIKEVVGFAVGSQLM